MWGMGAGGALSRGGRQLLQFAIMGGVGVTALGAYGYSNPDTPGLAWAQANRALLIAAGVGAIAFGSMLSWYSSQRMMRRMTSGMPGMGGMMPGAAPIGMPMAPAVKVRCRSCQALEDETAKFCSQCGAPTA